MKKGFAFALLALAFCQLAGAWNATDCEYDSSFSMLYILQKLETPVADIMLLGVSPIGDGYRAVTFNITSKGATEVATVEMLDHSSYTYTLRSGNTVTISVCNAVVGFPNAGHSNAHVKTVYRGDPVKGEPLFNLSLAKGWNYITMPTNETLSMEKVAPLCDSPSVAWGYSASHGGYEAAGVLEPGKGYWIDAYKDCDIGLYGNSTSAGESQSCPGFTLLRLNQTLYNNGFQFTPLMMPAYGMGTIFQPVLLLGVDKGGYELGTLAIQDRRFGTYLSPNGDSYRIEVCKPGSAKREGRDLIGLNITLVRPAPACVGYSRLRLDANSTNANISDGNSTLQLDWVDESGKAHLYFYYGSHFKSAEARSNSTADFDLDDGNTLRIENCLSFQNKEAHFYEAYVRYSVIGPGSPQGRPIDVVYIAGPNTTTAYGLYDLVVDADKEAHNVREDMLYAYRVDWGDGSNSILNTSIVWLRFQHIYQSPGSYNISVSEIDPLGRCSNAGMQVTVLAQKPVQPHAQADDKCPHFAFLNIGSNITVGGYALRLNGIDISDGGINGNPAIIEIFYKGKSLGTVSAPENKTTYVDAKNSDKLKIEVCRTSPYWSMNAWWASVKFSLAGPSQPPNLPPTIFNVSGPTMLNTTQPGIWDVYGYDPEQMLLSYSVQWGDGSSNEPGEFHGMFWHAYQKQGTYLANFTVTDENGSAASSILPIAVETSHGGIPLESCKAWYALANGVPALSQPVAPAVQVARPSNFSPIPVEDVPAAYASNVSSQGDILPPDSLVSIFAEIWRAILRALDG